VFTQPSHFYLDVKLFSQEHNCQETEPSLDIDSNSFSFLSIFIFLYPTRQFSPSSTITVFPFRVLATVLLDGICQSNRSTCFSDNLDSSSSNRPPKSSPVAVRVHFVQSAVSFVVQFFRRRTKLILFSVRSAT
jgi:hypothetical protein